MTPEGSEGHRIGLPPETWMAQVPQNPITFLSLEIFLHTGFLQRLVAFSDSLNSCFSSFFSQLFSPRGGPASQSSRCAIANSTESSVPCLVRPRGGPSLVGGSHSFTGCIYC